MNMAVMLWGLLFGCIGMYYFIYGKKADKPVMRYTGLVLMLYPYFVQNTIAIVIVGLVLIFLPRFIDG